MNKQQIEEEEKRLMLAMSMVETAVQDMAEAGLSPQQISIGLAFHMSKQADLAMPTKETAAIFKISLIRE